MDRLVKGTGRIATLLIPVAVLALEGCTLIKTIVHNFPDLDDHGVFASRTVDQPKSISPLRTLIRVPRFMTDLRVPRRNGGDSSIDEYLTRTRTVAFVVMHGDRIVFERYARGHDQRSLLNSFSIAKSVVGTLIGIAQAEGRIASLEDTVARYRPEFAGTAYGAVTLRSLLGMTSGMVDDPALLPSRASYYYGEDLHALTARAVTGAPIQGRWRYSDADVQMLGFVLEGATGMSVSAYLAGKLWGPLGMESHALWSLDREGGVEKAFCCLRASARDFARFGRLHLQQGRWNGAQIVPAAWVARAALQGMATGDGSFHQQLWWLPPDRAGDFYAYGHNGQYLYVNPQARTVIVKFSETRHQDPVPLFRAIAGALNKPENIAELDGLGAHRVALHSTTERRTP
jgi:CubicO group peptidase (beta-lactamase class C family)